MDQKELPSLPGSQGDRDLARKRSNRTSRISVRMVTNIPSSPSSSPSSPSAASSPATGSSFGYANESTADSAAAAAVVQQEMNNVQKLKRLSLGSSMSLDPDLPAQFPWSALDDPASSSGDEPEALSSSSPPASPVQGKINQSHASELLWVPAHVHPELAPQEWKSFVQDKVAEIRAKTMSQQAPSRLSTERTNDVAASDSPSGSSGIPARSRSSPSSGGGLSRRNSLLSRQIRSQADYQDGSDAIQQQKRRSSGDAIHASADTQSISSLSEQLKQLGELESLAMNPFALARSLSYSPVLASSSSQSLSTQSPTSSSSMPASPSSASQPTSPTSRSPSSSFASPFPASQSSPSLASHPSHGRKPSAASMPAATSQPLANDSDEPILAAPSASLRRSTRTRYHKNSMRRRQVRGAEGTPEQLAGGIEPLGMRKASQPVPPSLRRSSTDTEVAVAALKRSSMDAAAHEPQQHLPRRPSLPAHRSEPAVGGLGVTQMPEQEQLPQLPTRKRPSLKETNPELFANLSEHKTEPEQVAPTDREPVVDPAAAPMRNDHTRRDFRQGKLHVNHDFTFDSKPLAPAPSEQTSIDKDEARGAEKGGIVHEEAAQVGQSKALALDVGPESATEPQVPKMQEQHRPETQTGQNEDVPPEAGPITDTGVTGPAHAPAPGPGSGPVSGAVGGTIGTTPPAPVSKPLPKIQVPDPQSVPPPAPSPTGSTGSTKSKSRKGWRWLFSNEKGEKGAASDRAEKGDKAGGDKLSKVDPAPSPVIATTDKESVDRILNRTAEEEAPQTQSRSFSSFLGKKKVKKTESMDEMHTEYDDWGKPVKRKGKQRSKKAEKAAALEESEPVGGHHGMPPSGLGAGDKLDRLAQQKLIQEQIRIQQLQQQEAAQYGESIQLPYHIPSYQMSDKSMVMLYHRYPLHVERAIYRLSHLKLANPRRPLAQQVLLSNFMYAYLNLINHGYQQQQLALQRQAAGGGPGPEPGPGPEYMGYEYEYDAGMGYGEYDNGMEHGGGADAEGLMAGDGGLIAAGAAAGGIGAGTADGQYAPEEELRQGPMIDSSIPEEDEGEAHEQGDYDHIYSRYDTHSPSAESSSSSSSSGTAGASEDMWLGDEAQGTPAEPPASYYMPTKSKRHSNEGIMT